MSLNLNLYLRLSQAMILGVYHFVSILNQYFITYIQDIKTYRFNFFNLNINKSHLNSNQTNEGKIKSFTRFHKNLNKI